MAIGKNETIIAVVCLIVVAAITIIAISLQSDGIEVNEIDLEGQWQAVEIETIDMNGKITTYDVDDVAIVDYDIFIYKNNNGVVNGYIFGNLFTGAYSNQTVISDTYNEDTGVSYHTNSFLVSDNSMRIVMTATHADGSMNFTLTGNYTKDRSDGVQINCPDITGDWNCVVSEYLDSENIHQIEDGGTLRITSQGKSTFSGTLDQIVDQKVTTTYITGGFNDSSNGRIVGFAIDELGQSWNIYAKGDAIALNTCIYTDDMNGEMDIVCSLRLYSKGTEVPPIAVPIDLEGTTWRGMSAVTVDQSGTFNKIGMQYIINFETQRDALVYGTISSGSDVEKFVGFIYNSDPIEINIVTTDESYRYGKVFFENDKTFSFINDNIVANVSNSTIITYELEEEDIIYDVVGHWYNSFSEGYNGDNEYETSEMSTQRHHYELNIYGVVDNMFYCYYDGVYVSGSIENNQLSFRCDTNDGYLQFDGRLISSGYLVVTQKYYYYDDDDTTPAYFSVWNGFFSLEKLDDAEIPKYNIDISGVWNYISRESFSDIIYPLVGEKITIENYNGNTFTGLMEQANSEKKVIERVVKGVVEEYYTDSDGKIVVIGSIVDEVGFYWKFILYDEEYLIMHSTLVSEVADNNNKLVSTERIFTRNGTGDLPDIDCVDINGTEWELVNRYVMTPGGNHYEDDIEYTMKFTDTERVLFYGWSNYGGGTSIGGQIAGFLMDNKIYIGSLFGGSDVPDSGYGWINDDTMTLIEYYMIDGEWCTTFATFTRTN